MDTKNNNSIVEFELKNKILKTKKTSNTHWWKCFYSDINLEKENIITLNDDDVFLCIDEYTSEETKEYKSYIHFQRTIKILYNSNIYYIPVTIIYNKISKYFYLDDFIIP